MLGVIGLFLYILWISNQGVRAKLSKCISSICIR